MNRRRLLSALPVLVAVLAALLVPLAGAAPEKQPLMISERNELTGPNTQAGTWVGAGAVNDAGPVTAQFTVIPHGPGQGLLTGTHVLTGSEGSITVETRALVLPFPPPSPPRALAEGTWMIVDATGAYEGLEARGKIYATADFTTGEITIVRDGTAR